MAEDGPKRGDTALAVVMLCVVALSLGAAVWMMALEPSARDLTLIGGLAGASTASIAFTLQASRAEIERAVSTSRRVVAALTYLAGFVAGGFSIVASLALLGFSTAIASMPGAALLGGIYGIALGAYWSKLLDESTKTGSVLAPARNALEGRLAGSSVTNWTGSLRASARPATGEIVLAELSMIFVPESKAKSRGLGSYATSARSTYGEALHWEVDLLVQGGDDGDFADFVLSVTAPHGIDVFPRRQLARVARSRESEAYTFSIANMTVQKETAEQRVDGQATTPGNATLSSVREHGASGKGNDSRGAPRKTLPLLVDVSMAGRTIQVLECAISLEDSDESKL